jgi:putative ABC transport system permease protein
MVPIARRNLLAEKTRLLINVGGVAFSVMLILILWGLYQGFDQASTAYIDSVPADIWVSQEGSSDMFHTVSLLPTTVRNKLRSISEVAYARRLVGRQVSVEVKGQDTDIYIMGYDTKNDIGGPVRLVEGSPQPERGQIIVDKVFAHNNGLRIGDVITILDEDFEIVGISEKGNMMVYQYAFIPKDQAIRILGMSGLSNYYLVGLEDGADPEKVSQKIEDRISGVDAWTKAEWMESNRKVIADSFLPIILVLVVIGFAVGVMVIGLTIYTATVEQSREYGVLKAIGATNWKLYGIVFKQAMLSGLLGYLLGSALALVVNQVTQDVAPVFVTALGPADLAGLLVLSMAMSLLASYIPVRRVVSIDPAMVFRA